MYKAEKHSDMPMSYRRPGSKPGSSQLEQEDDPSNIQGGTKNALPKLKCRLKFTFYQHKNVGTKDKCVDSDIHQI